MSEKSELKIKIKDIAEIEAKIKNINFYQENIYEYTQKLDDILEESMNGKKDIIDEVKNYTGQINFFNEMLKEEYRGLIKKCQNTYREKGK